MLRFPYFNIAKIDNLTQNPELLERNIVTGRIVLSILTGSFLIISTIILIFTSKNVVSPISKLIKKELTIYTIPEFKKEVFIKKDALLLAYNLVDENLKFSLLKNNIELDLKIFLETGEEKEKQKK